MKNSILIRGGHVIDPANRIDRMADVLISDGRIVGVGEVGQMQIDTIIDAAGMIVTPGLIDMHTHLREPGYEESETIDTGRKAAAAGGFTAIACMPNTEPALETQASLEYVIRRASESPGPALYPIAAISRDRRSRELTDFPLLISAGAVAFSDDGSSVLDTELMRKAMRRIRPLRKPVIEHCEVPELAAGGVINEGPAAKRFGLPPISAASEWRMVERDVDLARATGCALHIAHISTAKSVEIVERAKQDGLNVTAEVTPHHIALCDEDIPEPNPDFKMNPPLRGTDDVAALRKALAGGVIDAVACDHAPHSPAAKAGGFAGAAFGVTGLETSLAVIATQMADMGIMTWGELVLRMSAAPARILGIEGGTLSIGVPADITVIDPDREWSVNPAKFASKGRNTCFAGSRMKGKVLLTIVGGGIVFDGRESDAAL